MKSIFLLITYVMAVSVAHGQLSNSTNYTRPAASQGFRFALIKPNLSLKVENKFESKLEAIKDSSSVREDVDSSYGIAFGYSYLPVSQIGFTTQLGYLKNEIKENDTKLRLELARLEANAAYALNQQFYFKAGLNVVDVQSSNSDVWEDFDSGIGYQAGLGYQINSQWGLELGYTDMRISEKLNDSTFKSDIQVFITGYELSLTATF